MSTPQPDDKYLTKSPLIELRSVSRFYGTVIGANDLNLVLQRGAYGLVGPNGAGKTTFIELITGGLRPSMGQVRLFGYNPANRPSVLSKLGICPAQDVLLPNVSALDWVKSLLQVSGFHPRLAEERAAEHLQRVGLGEAMRLPMGSYSLGMRQRAKLAQALAHDPELLILDEPFNGLDPIARHQMTELLKHWAEQGKSLILASHVLHEVEAVTDAFLLIYGGRLLASGSAGELRTLLANLPQEITIESIDAGKLAALLVDESSIESLAVSAERTTLRVSVREPIHLYGRLLTCSAEQGIRIERISGADGDLSALFRTLTSRHRGQN